MVQTLQLECGDIKREIKDKPLKGNSVIHHLFQYGPWVKRFYILKWLGGKKKKTSTRRRRIDDMSITYELLICVHEVIWNTKYPWNSPGKNAGVFAISFPKGSSWPRNHTDVFCIAGRFFAIWVTREAHLRTQTHLFVFTTSMAAPMLLSRQNLTVVAETVWLTSVYYLVLYTKILPILL